MTTFIRITLLVVALSGCYAGSPDATQIPVDTPLYIKLGTSDFAAKIDALSDEQIVDVRSYEEYKTGHIADAVVLDYRSADFRKKVDTLDRSKPVLVYCAAGGRSSAAAKVMNELGFAEVYELQGGLTTWVGEGRTVVE